VKEHNQDVAKIYFKDLGFTVVTGSRYLGGFIGEAPDQQAWIQEKTASWVSVIRELALVAEKYPQVAYAGLQKSLQQEWQFLQRVTKNLAEEFGAIEEAIQEKFLPALFGDDITNDVPQRIACLPVKKAGLAIPNPTETADTNWTASTVICGNLILAIRGMEVFSSTKHTSIMNAGKAETAFRYLSESQDKLSRELLKLPGG
jgi:hypothetical protein